MDSALLSTLEENITCSGNYCNMFNCNDMQFCFWLFCAACVCVWLIGWGILAVEWIANICNRLSETNQNAHTEVSKPTFRGLLLLPLLMILGGCCAKTTPLQSDRPCIPIYGRASDWDVISDDLARNIYRHNLMCAEINP